MCDGGGAGKGVDRGKGRSRMTAWIGGGERHIHVLVGRVDV